MIRFALVLGALFFAPAALACGGSDCGGNCAMLPATANVDDVEAAAGTKGQFSIEGMKCGKCADKVTAALKAIDGVNAVNVDSGTGIARVAFDAAKTDLDALVSAVNEGGHYKASKSDKS